MDILREEIHIHIDSCRFLSVIGTFCIVNEERFVTNWLVLFAE